MKKRNLVINEADKGVQRERDSIPWKYCLMTLICGTILVLGFFWAASLHFAAMDLGIKNAKLRQQKDDLNAERKRLQLEKEKSLSPSEIEKLAKEMGLQKIANESFEYLGLERNSGKNTSPEKEKTMSFRKAQPETEKAEKAEKAEKDKKSNEKSKNGKEENEKDSSKDKLSKETGEENRKADKKGEKQGK